MKALIVLLAVMLATPAWAQPAAAPAPAERREKVKKRIRALRAYTLTEELSLDELTASKLFPILSKWDDEIDKLLVARTDLQRRLEASATEKDAKVVDKLIDDAVANQRALWDAEDKRLKELRKILTPAQTARVLIVLPAMERKIQNQLRRAVQQQQQQPQQQKRTQPDTSGELGGNPYAPIDPFNDARPRQPAPKKQQRKSDANCDPFGDMHNCK